MLMSLIMNLNLSLNHSVPFLMILIMNLLLDADEFDHESDFDFACILESFYSFSDELDYEFAT